MDQSQIIRLWPRLVKDRIPVLPEPYKMVRHPPGLRITHGQQAGPPAGAVAPPSKGLATDHGVVYLKFRHGTGEAGDRHGLLYAGEWEFVKRGGFGDLPADSYISSQEGY